ncbi:hypothetical protein LTR37_008757 [Vermiconidia calcicola]|uniref:Uncharacterized protein n=1 Tax=Vermiconidia calcicola TaxID=1690605 RepID=A0ACC3NAF1_9PEZI|nr:hypothetical protein LTR37_008757 [Vermiconidia calcicola]
MSSHVPFLAVRPDDQFDTDVKKTPRIPRSLRANASPSSKRMDSPPPLTPRTYAASRIPAAIRFPLVLILSFSLSTLLHSLAAEYTGLQLASASRALDQDWQIATLVGWKVTELTTAWIAGYDYEDIAALTILTNQPYYYLVNAFYGVDLFAVALSLAFDVVVIAIPFALLRPLTRAHDPNAPRSVNQVLATDWQIMMWSAALGATVYAVAFSITYYAHFTSFMVVHFDDIPNVGARDSTVGQLMQLFGATGIAAMLFLFRPAISAAGKPQLTEQRHRSRKAKKFNPETATLGETFAYNLGYGPSGFSHRVEVLLKRTLVVAAFTFANTFVRVYGTVDKSDATGALAYGGIWAAAHVLVGVGYGVLSNDE